MTYNEKWNIKLYAFALSSDCIISKDITTTTNIDILFSKLVKSNICSLPDQDRLTTEKYSYNPEINKFYSSDIEIGCGTTGYTIQFKIGYLYRQYSYYNPTDFADFHPHIYELRRFENIANLLSELTTK